jgi:glucan phosphoethanolaminetransferase (alkaline phosphatase superfamily)
MLSGIQARIEDALLSVQMFYAAGFGLALVAFENVVFRPRYARLIAARHWADENYFRLAVFVALAAIGVGIVIAFVRVAISGSWFVRVVCLLLFFFAAAFEYSVYDAFGRFSRLDDVALALLGIDFRIGSDAVAQYFNWLAFVPAAAFALLLTLTRGTREFGPAALIAVLVSSGVFFAFTSYFTKNEFYAASLANSARTAVSFPVSWYVGTADGPPEAIAYARPRERIGYRSATAPANNIVFIVDESVRGDRLSLNGHTEPTTPFLDRLRDEGLVKNWGIAAAGTTCSHTANPLLLTGLTELPDRRFRVHTMPTIFQYARAMNYRNHYFDGQVSTHWLGKRSDVADYGRWTKAEDLRRPEMPLYEIDAEIARRVAEIVSSSTGNFIWVSKFGVHTPYTDSFPNERVREALDSMPADYDPAIDENAIAKLYDAAIAYNIGSFFSTLLASGPAPDTIYIYTSDHGQTLREGGTNASHCMESRAEAVVPLFIIARPSLLPPLDESYRASHANLFATMLDAMKFPETERHYPYALSLYKARGADSAPRVYYGGELNRARKLPFD